MATILDLDSAFRNLEIILNSYNAYRKNGREEEADGIRMQFWGAKGMLEAIAGPAEKEKTLAKLRAKGFKIPRGGEREPDGTFLAIDADADDF
jgi:hypothetical protein